MEGVPDIMNSINTALETTWTKKQLARGKWFEIKRVWTKNIISALVQQYETAGWKVIRRAELSREGTKVFLVIGHPRYFEAEYFSGRL